MAFDESLNEKLKASRLRYLSENSLGILRQKINDKFQYYDHKGNRITDEKTLKRIEGMVIPPAWENVWISPAGNTHIQATGFDEKGRKQYIYHPEWIRISQESKFNNLVKFAEHLPKIRNKVRAHLNQEELDKRTIIAAVVWLLENTFIRIGNDEYAKENNSYGVTTLRHKHVAIERGRIRLTFKGKSGIAHDVEVSHPKITKIIKKCVELPGYELFQYIDDEGNRQTVDSEQINEYLQEITGEDITAKDFRTWGATYLSAITLKDFDPPETEKEFKKSISETVKTVCSHLRNTPSVCRNYYIHPAVIDSYKNKKLQKHFEECRKSNDPEKSKFSVTEYAVYKLLTRQVMT